MATQENQMQTSASQEEGRLNTRSNNAAQDCDYEEQGI